MAEISEREMKERKKAGRPPGRRQVEHFIMRIEPKQKQHLIEMATARHMNMSEFMNWLLGMSWKNYLKNKEKT
jgi:hypothetical protein